jgi:hypothetical protein
LPTTLTDIGPQQVLTFLIITQQRLL